MIAGALIKVSNPDRPEVRPHLARIWPSQDVANASTALLPPTLAYNLGLALHLLPLLHYSDNYEKSNEIDTDMSTATSDGDGPLLSAPPAPHSRITIEPFTETYPQDQLNATRSEDQIQYQDPMVVDNDGTEYAALPQPEPLDPGKIPIAKEVHVSVVREPTSGWLPPNEDGQPPQTSISENISGADAVQAIQSYFIGGLRVVCEGDVLAVLKKDAWTPAAQVLGNLTLPITENNDSSNATEEPSSSFWEFSRFLFFRVARVVPEGKVIQAVDVASTMVKLAGTCSSGIPVGLRGYLTPQEPPQALLGWHAGAAAQQARWSLPFVGEMLPCWRQIAHLAATVLHPASTSIRLRLAVLLHGPAGSGRRTAVAAAAAALGCHMACINCKDIRGEGQLPDSKVAEGLKVAFDIAGRYRPSFLVLDEFQALSSGGDPHADAAASRLGAVLAECIASGSDRTHVTERSQLFPSPILLIACAKVPDEIPFSLRRCFTHEIATEAPDGQAREALLRSFMGSAGAKLDPDEWADLGRHSAGLLPRDLKSFAADTCAAAAVGTLPPAAVLDSEDAVPNTGPVAAPAVGETHISAALSSARDRMATDIGAPKIPNVLWDDIGGLEDVKASILDTVELPLKHPELFSGGLRRRSGVLLYGPPGTGKTLLAKAVATECAVNFLSVKGPELINMYVGESERQVREVFARARRARPCVVFFDELDSLAPARGRGSDSGGVMDRVVSQLLAEIDSAQGGSGTDDVFFVGATNRPDLLDPALLRPGRLDKLLYVGVASDAVSQLKVIKALTRKFALETDVNLERVAEQCPPRLTGADLYALCSDSWMIALKRHVAAKESGEIIEGGVVVQQADFEIALKNLRPSLHEEDIARYEKLRDQYAGK